MAEFNNMLDALYMGDDNV